MNQIENIKAIEAWFLSSGYAENSGIMTTVWELQQQLTAPLVLSVGDVVEYMGFIDKTTGDRVASDAHTIGATYVITAACMQPWGFVNYCTDANVWIDGEELRLLTNGDAESLAKAEKAMENQDRDDEVVQQLTEEQRAASAEFEKVWKETDADGASDNTYSI